MAHVYNFLVSLVLIHRKKQLRMDGLDCKSMLEKITYNIKFYEHPGIFFGGKWGSLEHSCTLCAVLRNSYPSIYWGLLVLGDS